MIDKKLETKLKENGYVEIREVPNVGICALRGFMFTVGLVVGLDENSFRYRYCYPHKNAGDAVGALRAWDGTGDPLGNWIKKKGDGFDETNPNYTKNID